MKKIVTILGARPQFIKASAVSRALRETGRKQEILVHTGQHFDANMSEIFFRELDMCAPDYNLDIHGGTHGEMTGRMLVEVERVLIKERPAAVLVYGDTNSTIAGALAATKLHIPVAHVEAGLRSFNPQMPEEINRILTDRISRWLFAPTGTAVRNLLSEGVAESQILEVGDVMFDVALQYGARANSQMLRELDLEGRPYVLATIHRAENTDDESRLTNLVDALAKIARQRPVVWPIHPRTRQLLARRHSGNFASPGLHLLNPVGYLAMVELEKNAAVIATDSGGIQKEAFFHRVPCVTLRHETEWVELVQAGWNRLAPPISADSVSIAIEAAIGTKGNPIAPYGHGDSAVRIAARLNEDI